MNIELSRMHMIEQQIRPWNVSDPQILETFSVVKREDFVPPAYRSIAFADLRIPLLGTLEEALQSGHCMLEPKVEARMLQDLALQTSDTVLEVGAGSGYMAALMARKARRVVSLEIVPELASMARNNIRRAGIDNVEIRQADGASSIAAEDRFDAIVLSGSVAEVPDNLLTLLKPDGRLVAIVGQEPMMRATCVTRIQTDRFRVSQGWDTVAPRLQNFPEPSRFQF
ncbi:MAG: protein-L-isoaspartate O-methyltransferase [Rhodoferax sp.]|nr:protein-L-isoaspartate O-methyltransferase [Rhodoferax sp.]